MSKLSLLDQTPLLSTESREEYADLKRSLWDRLKPRDVIEELYAAEFLNEQVEVARYGRMKRGLLNAAMPRAVVRILQTLNDRGVRHPFTMKESTLLRKWHDDEVFRHKIIQFLTEHGFDEATIEGEAIRQTAAPVSQAQGLLSLAQARRDKSLHMLGDYRDYLGGLLHKSPPAIEQPRRPLVLEGKSSAA